MVLYCIEKNCAIDDLSIEELKEISDVFEADVFDAISLKTCVEKRVTTGAPGPEQMKDVIEVYHKYLKYLLYNYLFAIITKVISSVSFEIGCFNE